MKKITRQDMANTAAEKFKDNYFKNGIWGECILGSSKYIHKRLVALGDKPEIDAVNQVIGNPSWTRIICHECSTYNADYIIQVGSYGSLPHNLCPDCIERVYSLANSNE